MCFWIFQPSDKCTMQTIQGGMKCAAKVSKLNRKKVKAYIASPFGRSTSVSLLQFGVTESILSENHIFEKP